VKTRFWAERSIDAPATVVYHCLADYREHHRPDGFLPPAFEQLEIARGGVGAGTEYRFVMVVGGRRRAVSTTVSEPVPGHTLVETGSGIETTFTVEPTPGGAHVRFDTVIDVGGLPGILYRLFAARMLGPIYEDELRRLEDLAKAHEPTLPSRAVGVDVAVVSAIAAGSDLVVGAHRVKSVGPSTSVVTALVRGLA